MRTHTRTIGTRLTAAVLAGLTSLACLSTAAAASASAPSDEPELSASADSTPGPTISAPKSAVTFGHPFKEQLTLSPGAQVTHAAKLPPGLILTSTGLLVGTAAPAAAGTFAAAVTLTDSSGTVTRSVFITGVGESYDSRTLTFEVPWLGGRIPDQHCPSTHPWLRNETFPGHPLPKGVAAVTDGGLGISVRGTKVTDGSGLAIGVNNIVTTNLGSAGATHLVLHCTNDSNRGWK